MRLGRPKPPSRLVVRTMVECFHWGPCSARDRTRTPVEPLKTARSLEPGQWLATGLDRRVGSWPAARVELPHNRLLRRCSRPRPGQSTPFLGFRVLGKAPAMPTTGHPAVFGPPGTPQVDQSLPRFMRASVPARGIRRLPGDTSCSLRAAGRLSAMLSG